MQTGSMSTTEYLKIAGDVKSFMDSRGVAPEYAYGTSLGSYFGYENMVYSYSKILDYYNQNKILPSSVDVKQWVYPNAVPSELIPYTQSSANCQSNDASIKALATSITQNYATTYDKATAIFNWVRDNLSYSFYYNTKYGAVGALNARTGNCVDTAHLVVALSRAAGIPAKYVHGTCQFSSGSWYGHVWAQIWVDGKWYTADATSNYNTFGVINNWNTGTYTLKGTYISLPF
jgi:transglutaminase-like putative cysteine protease